MSAALSMVFLVAPPPTEVLPAAPPPTEVLPVASPPTEVLPAASPPTEVLPGIGKHKRCDVAPGLAGWRVGPERTVWSLEKVLEERPARRAVVVAFFATWCAPCLEGIPRLERLAKAHPDVAFVLVATPPFDPPLGPFLDRLQTKLPVVKDKFGSLWRAWSTPKKGGPKPALPRTVVLDRIPRIAAVIGQEGRDFEAVLRDRFTKVERLCSAPSVE